MRARRLLFGLILTLIVVSAAVYILRLPVAGFAARAVMAGAGMENPQARVTAISLQSIRLENVSAGAAAAEIFRFDTIEFDYHWRSLLQDREVEAVRMGPGAIRLVMSPDGRVSVVDLGEGDGSARKLPFKMLTLSDVDLLIDTPAGMAAGDVSAELNIQTGGHAAITLSTQAAGYNALRVENALISAKIALAENGSTKIDGAASGDIIAAATVLHNAAMVITAEGASWRDALAGRPAAFAGEARLDINAGDLPVDRTPSLAVLNTSPSVSFLGAPVSSLSVTGALKASLSKNGLSLHPASPNDQPVIRTDYGAALTIGSLGENPFFFVRGHEIRAAFRYELTDAKIEADGAIDAAQTKSGWRIEADATLGQHRSGQLDFDGAEVAIIADMTSDGVDADVNVNSNILKAKIGRLNIFDSYIDTSFHLAVNKAARQAIVTQPDACLDLKRVRLTIDQQDTETILTNARFCGTAEPAGVIDWSGALRTTVAGDLTAGHAAYRLGNTRLVGRPPEIDLHAVYQPAINQTLVTGNIDGGAMALNDFLNLNAANGHVTFLLDKEKMSSTVRLDRMRIVQRRDLPLVAPVMASGDLTLRGQKATFDYVLKTPAGSRLGEGVGIHDVATARGESRFNFDALEFAPEGLQPSVLLPVLRGVVSEATGAATGQAMFSWARSGIDSSADIHIDNITFSGPTRVVTQTAGVKGDIHFANLWPFTTKGAQMITVKKVDLDALQLEAGEITFELPGDETLRVHSAMFPWFGGALGVYDAMAACSGGAAIVPLRADKIDLAQIFDFVDVEGLSGEGILSGVLPLVVENGRARIEKGILKSDSPGAVRYRGKVVEKAATANEQAKIAFDLLRDLRYDSLDVTINGALDGRLQFQISLDGTGEVVRNNQNVRVPVDYNIYLDAALLELLGQAKLSRDIELQIRRGLATED